MKLAAAAGPRV